MSAACRSVFVVGAQRSGTTWLQRLLLEDPRCCGGQEAHFFATFGRVLHEFDHKASLPRPPDDEEETDEPRKEARKTAASREELYNSIEKNARLDSNFLLLVVLSTVVAAVGLLEDNVAVVIGAMVIAPLLGPNLAQALGVLHVRRHAAQHVDAHLHDHLVTAQTRPVNKHVTHTYTGRHVVIAQPDTTVMHR